MSNGQQFSLKRLREEAARLGITDDTAGGTVEDLVRKARDQDDPIGFLIIHAPSDVVNTDENEPAQAEHTDSVMDHITNNNPDEVKPIENVDEAVNVFMNIGSPLNSIPISASEEPPQIVEVCITVPLAYDGPFDGFLGRHVELRLDMEQANKLRRLQVALDALDERLANGRHVSNRSDAIKWIIDKLK